MRLKHLLGAIVSIGLLAFALFQLVKISQRYTYEEIISHLHDLPWWQVGLAFALSTASYLLLTCYDALAIFYLGKKVAYRRTALASFIGYTFSNNLGFALLTGSSVRYRLYSIWGLSPSEIAQLVVFCSITYFLGLFLVGGLSLVYAPPPLGADFPLELPAMALESVGYIAIASALFYLFLPLFWRKPLVFKGVEIKTPKFGISLAQYVIAALDWVFMCAVFYALLPPENIPSFPLVLTCFLFGNLIGVLLHVPGGIGVFELVVTYLLKDYVAGPQLLGALIAYRVVYYFLPFALALLLFGGYELLRTVQRVNTHLQPATRSLMAPILAMAIFACGAMMLFSGATPTRVARLEMVSQLPLFILESAHFLAAMTGILLVMMARNLVRHSHYAFRVARWLLPIGALLLLVKGLNIELAVFQLLVWLMLLPSSVYFTRRRSLLRAPYGVAWIVAISAVVLTTLFLSYFAFRQMPTFNAPWLEIATQNEASRALRSLLSVPLALALFGVARLLRPRRAVFALERDPAAIRAIANQSDRALTQLAFLGDKRFLLSPNRHAFLMYTTQDRSLIALGDPVGDASEFEELLWQFRELADKRNRRPVVYHARPENVQLYFDIGLIPHSLGEEAVLDLAKFNRQRADLQPLFAKVKQATAAGFSVEVIDPAALLEYLPQLERISAQWLSEHQTNERAFAVGHFDARFIAQFPHALFRVNGELRGFATVLPSAKPRDVRVDMIRYDGALPEGWMEVLFVQLIEWAQAHGHRQMKLGLVPVNDWTNHPLAALWHRMGRTLFLHNRAVETPEDVRSFKNQFSPRWEVRYLMSPAEVELYPILSDVGAVMLREKNSHD